MVDIVRKLANGRRALAAVQPDCRPPPPLTAAPAACRCSCLQKAIEALVRAQARLDHARNGAAAKQAARDAASARRTEVEEELQVGAPGACRERAGDASSGVSALMQRRPG